MCCRFCFGCSAVRFDALVGSGFRGPLESLFSLRKGVTRHSELLQVVARLSFIGEWMMFYLQMRLYVNRQPACLVPYTQCAGVVSSCSLPRGLASFLSSAAAAVASYVSLNSRLATWLVEHAVASNSTGCIRSTEPQLEVRTSSQIWPVRPYTGSAGPTL